MVLGPGLRPRSSLHRCGREDGPASLLPAQRLLAESLRYPEPYRQGKLGNVVSRLSGPAVGERTQRREERVLTPLDYIQPKGPCKLQETGCPSAPHADTVGTLNNNLCTEYLGHMDCNSTLLASSLFIALGPLPCRFSEVMASRTAGGTSTDGSHSCGKLGSSLP